MSGSWLKVCNQSQFRDKNENLGGKWKSETTKHFNKEQKYMEYLEGLRAPKLFFEFLDKRCDDIHVQTYAFRITFWGLFSRVHATLYVTMLVRPLVGRLVRNHFAFLGV